MDIWCLCTPQGLAPDQNRVRAQRKSRLAGPSTADQGLAWGNSIEYTANKLDVVPLGPVKSLEKRHLVLMGLRR